MTVLRSSRKLSKIFLASMLKFTPRVRAIGEAENEAIDIARLPMYARSNSDLDRRSRLKRQADCGNHKGLLKGELAE